MNRVVLGVWWLVVFVSCTPDRTEQATPFVEVTESAGLRFVHRSGARGELHYPEVMGAGVGLIDFDRDGDLDVYLANGGALEGRVLGAGDRVFRNEWVPSGRLRFSDVTEQVGAVAHGYGTSVTVGDIDGDHWPDLYVGQVGANVVLWNREGRFVAEPEQSEIIGNEWTTGAALFDADGDLDVDLVVINYVEFSTDKRGGCVYQFGGRDYCGPLSYPASPNHFFENLGGRRFRKRAFDPPGEPRPSLGITVFDADSDGDQDFYVANDQRENRLWLNNGQGLFVERGLQSGCAVNAEGRVEGSMGVDAGDFDGDGNLDLFMAHVDEETNTLFRGLGNGLFRDVSIRSGVGAPSLGLTGFAVRWLDYDFDGVLDLAVFNGAVKRQESRVTKDRFGAYQQPHMLLKGSRGSFSVVRSSGFATPSVARGVAFGDLDNDGDEDLVMSAVDGPARVFINSMSSPSGRWTALSAEDDIIQARIEHGSRWFFPRRFGGFLSSHDRRVVLGPIDCRPDSRIEVKTSDGVVRFVDATCGGYAVLEHGTDR